ncbi:hypothetical protein [Sphingomonas sp. S2-65]|uniref:hypothetical protein n=1 Tax=Sphingomonas sp. S2-65 TaxID=2903960 RepID=UPI001F3EE510|nr:hypothetical protein [Sphingomonas sp. S2-65]UYY59371.1 hypothetical protein LZ586_04615 [Sphingomonas sp. S2-65]
MRRMVSALRRHAGVAGAAFLATSAPAWAQDIAKVKSLDIAVEGRIAQRCALGTISTADFGELTRPGLTATALVSLDCNVPFTMGIKAQHGALAHAAMPQGQGPYAGSVPYVLSVEVPVRRPESELVSRIFEGRTLVGGQRMSSNGGIAIDGMRLRLTLGSTGSEAGLLAGQYGDVIEVTIAPN